MVIIDTGGVQIAGVAPGGVAIEGSPTVKINCMTPILAPMPMNSPAVTDLPEDPDGADSSKPGFVSNPKKSGG